LYCYRCIKNTYMKKTIFVLSLFLAGVAATRVQAQVSVGLQVNIAPPAIPVYEQPACPVDGYIWIPGYWAYGDAGYYWVPGYWDAPPTVGFLWTPGYWGFVGGVYAWHAGYWGPHVGFYGGINYGFGYGGVGYGGGEWRGGHFVNRTVTGHFTANRASFNGGSGGVQARPTAQQETAMHERHVGGTTAQTQHEQAAAHDHNQLASVNHGRPANAAHAGTANTAHTGAANAGHAAGTTGLGHPSTMSHHQTANRTQMNRAPANHPSVSRQPQVHTMSHNAPPASHPAPAVAHGAPHGGAPHGGGGGGHHH
jgi:WXXGXW repeat (2 copies)